MSNQKKKKQESVEEKRLGQDGGVYMVVADETEEFLMALRYATKIARIRKGRVGIMHVVDVQDFQHWGKIEDRMRREQRARAEHFVWEVAKNVLDWGGAIPAIYISEGPLFDTVIKEIDADETIKRLILATSGVAGKPGPLVTYFVNKGLGRINIPLLIIPGQLDIDRAEILA